MKYLFIVQGEGRGHMTQALALKQYLAEAGHTITGILVGISPRRAVPPFFYEKTENLTKTYESPNFKTDKQNKKVSYIGTIIYNSIHIKRYIKSLIFINQIIKKQKPDVIINFYEFLAGIYYLFYRPSTPMICIGHQYLLQHPEFEIPNKKSFNYILFNLNTIITSFRASAKLALSFREMPNVPHKNIYVMPPLLRKEIFKLKTTKEPFLLLYLLNTGCAEEIIKWHKNNNETLIHVFWDNKQAEDIYKYSENLFFHKIDDTKFLDFLRRCSGYMCTAGFESICEAMYLEKPFFAVPVEGHFEQQCNALDATKSRTGLSGSYFDIDRFKNYLLENKHNYQSIKDWMNSSPIKYTDFLHQNILTKS